MHCQSELESDLGYEGPLPDEVLLKWSRDRYSTSKHLLTLYNLAKNLGHSSILEIGFGRSSFVLAKAAIENGANFTTCDVRDFSYLFNDVESKATNFVNDLSGKVWRELSSESVEFAFLDYFSGEDISARFVESEIELCLEKMKGNGVIAIHDVFDSRYVVGKTLLKMARSFKFRRKFSFSFVPCNYGLGILTVSPSKKKNVITERYIKK